MGSNFLINISNKINNLLFTKKIGMMMHVGERENMMTKRERQ